MTVEYHKSGFNDTNKSAKMVSKDPKDSNPSKLSFNSLLEQGNFHLKSLQGDLSLMFKIDLEAVLPSS